jgi:peptidoglycan-N-acetylglucosamine deacetylase
MADGEGRRRDRAILVGAAVVLAFLALDRQASSEPADRGTVVEKPVLRPTEVPVTSLPGGSASGCAALDVARVERNAPGVGRTVALTFDDGPGPWTGQVLDVLRRERVPASFFLMGEAASGRTAAVATLVDAGHLVGVHGWSLTASPFHRPWQPDTLDRQLHRTEQVLRRSGGMDCWFRPPNRAMDGVQPTARLHGLTVALWTVDSGDWNAQLGRGTAPKSLVDRIVRQATAVGDQQHPVLLLHDGGGYCGATVAALPRIIDFYRSRGYRFLRIDGSP